MSWEVQTMKLKTSCCKVTLLKKDLSHFFPFWILYVICLGAGLLSMTRNGLDRSMFVIRMAQSVRYMAIVNFGYALLAAQLLFGDLYDSRLCSGIHSLPIRREGILSVHILSGMLVSLIPNAAVTLAAVPLVMANPMMDGWQIPLWWLLGTELQYVFFFGLGVFCAFCTGNRVAQAAFYLTLNFAAPGIRFLAEVLYVPLLEGVVLQGERFSLFCPVLQISNHRLLYCEYWGISGTEGYAGGFRTEPGWGYLIVCAGVGVLLMGGALLLYRRRKLETAGDFTPLPCLRPAVPVCIGIAAAVVMQMLHLYMFSHRTAGTYVFGMAGLIIGWFAGKMLLEKTTRVSGSLGGLAVLITAVAASLLLTGLDPAGIAAWTPDPQKVAGVWISDGYGNNPTETPEGGHLPFTDADIRQVIGIHQTILEEGAYADYRDTESHNAGRPQEEWVHPSRVDITYQMKNGSTVRRSYAIWPDSAAGEAVKIFLSRPEVVMGNEFRTSYWQDLIREIHVEQFRLPVEKLTQYDLHNLTQAIMEDCRQGDMALNSDYHLRPLCRREDGSTIDSLWLFIELDRSQSLYLRIYRDSEHTLQWMKDQGFYEDILSEFWQRYDTGTGMQ